MSTEWLPRAKFSCFRMGHCPSRPKESDQTSREQALRRKLQWHLYWKEAGIS